MARGHKRRVMPGPHGIDSVMLERDFEKEGIPVLVLEREYDSLADAGRIKTRVQAFLERIG